MGLELTTDRYPSITSKTRYPQRHVTPPLETNYQINMSTKYSVFRTYAYMVLVAIGTA